MRRFAWVLVFGGFLFLVWRVVDKGALFDQSGLSGRVEEAVDGILVRHGVQESDIRKVHRVERKKKFPVPASWIETEREITLKDDRVIPPILADLKQSVQPFGLSVTTKPAGLEKESSGPGEEALASIRRSGRVEPLQLVVECGKKGRVFQRLIFSLNSRPGRVRVAVVIDDVAGRKTDLDSLENFFSLGIPITYAVLPMEKLTKSAAEKIHQFGDEVIVHQPMEPEDLGHHDPGRATLLIRMNRQEMKRIVQQNFQSVPYAAGVSNHMGSKFTENRAAMASFFHCLKEVAEPGSAPPLFFFDSRTTSKIVGRDLSKEAGLNYLVNDIFLDHEDNLQQILKQLRSLKKKAKQKGSAVSIGHIQRTKLVEALRQAIPEFQKEGIEFARLSDLIRNPSDFTHPSSVRAGE